MNVGFFGLNVGIDRPEAIIKMLKTAEQLGYESVWTGEHLVVPENADPASPYPPQMPFMDTIATLSFAAAHTSTLKIGSGLVVLPMYNPIVLAKQLASIDVLSKGRLMVGLGIGYMKEEYDALGIPFKERGARGTEHIDVLKALWTQEKPAFTGRFSNFSDIQSRPQPVQKPHPPLHIGGLSDAALLRAVRQGQGWYGTFQDIPGTADFLKKINALIDSGERPEALGKLEISVTPSFPLDKSSLQEFEALGVDRLIIMRDFVEQISNWGESIEDDIIRFLEESAKAIDLS